VNGIIAAVLSLSGLGFAFGLLLAWMSKKFQVDIDPRITKVSDLLPGINCGACGLAGCSSFAESLVGAGSELTSCVACSTENKQNIVEVLGITAADIENVKSHVAAVACNGGKRAKDKFNYTGFADCRVAVTSMGGGKLCGYACVGEGTCAKVCPFGAIEMAEDGLPVINAKLCVGCKKCVQACPRNIMFMMNRKKKVYIKCCSQDKGPQVMKKCKAGCISCFKCVKECPVKAITMVNNLATIDYDKCTNCMKCVKVCPTKVIAVL